MSKDRVTIPACVRIGLCKECGAQVYAPEGGGRPLMSSCSCAGERKVLGAGEASKLPRRRGRAESEREEKGRAA